MATYINTLLNSYFLVCLMLKLIFFYCLINYVKMSSLLNLCRSNHITLDSLKKEIEKEGEDLDLTDVFGTSGLGHLCRGSDFNGMNPEMLKHILKLEPDISAKDSENKSALWWLCHHSGKYGMDLKTFQAMNRCFFRNHDNDKVKYELEMGRRQGVENTSPADELYNNSGNAEINELIPFIFK